MNIRFADPDEISRWDELLTRNPDGGNIFQSHQMALTKQQNGWKPRYVFVESLAVTVLEKRLPILGKFWYIPKGPGLCNTEDLLIVASELKDFAAMHGVFAVKLEPEIVESSDAHAALQQSGLVPTRAIQPNSSTVVVDLLPTLEQIMANFNQKGRHAINRAARDGVTTAAVDLTEQNMRTMYDLLAATAVGRFDSSLKSYSYYRKFWQNFASDGRGSLFFAYYQGKVIASAYCMYLGKKGLYKDGASVREKTAYGASHLLQWQAMQWMKNHGVESYDLCGAPHSSQVNDVSGHFYGIGRFKTSFNKHITDYIGCYDLIVGRRRYKLWQKIGERLAISLSWRLKHRQWY